jgi:NAD(P)-dependent dehydrogenase (short-subunit alcohol dehydrogenase family)
MIREQFELDGKTALVMGGRGFLGRRFCAALTEFGAEVHAADLSDASPAARHDPSAVSQAGVRQHVVDVADPASVAKMVGEVAEQSGQIDILVYSVTAKPHDFYKPYTDCSLEGWQTIMRAELDGLFLATQQVGRIMETAGRGSMIFLSSIYGVVGNDQRIYQGSNLAHLYGSQADAPKQIYAHAGYATVKGAVISLARFLAAYWGEKGIRVNCISPGGLAHPGENEAFLQRYSQRTPLGRKAGLDEISGAVVFLASDASSYVTGHNLVVDGGWTAW